MFLYETHMHTKPVSGCAHATPEESVEFYHSIGYDGVIVTNHFGYDEEKPESVEEQLRFYVSDFEKARKRGRELGIKVFFGAEMGFWGTDFLVYGPEPQWYYAHPEMAVMPVKKRLPILAKEGALIIHAHPFREADYIDCIRLFPRAVHGVEVFNGNRTPHENHMASVYAGEYGLIPFAGSDNHVAGGDRQKFLGGMQTETPISDLQDFIARVKDGTAKPFALVRETMAEFPIELPRRLAPVTEG